MRGAWGRALKGAVSTVRIFYPTKLPVDAMKKSTPNGDVRDQLKLLQTDISTCINPLAEHR